MLLGYTAGKYRAETEWELIENIRLAEQWAAWCWKIGLPVICPHKNTAHYGGIMGIPDSVWLEGDLEMIRRCDVLVVMDNWRSSSGTKDEIKLAEELEIPIFYMPEDSKKLVKWVRSMERAIELAERQCQKQYGMSVEDTYKHISAKRQERKEK